MDSKEYRRDWARKYNQEHPLRSVWGGMMRRCGHHKGASDQELDWYARRGITVCDEWRSSYKLFETWALANGWKKGLQVDRIDNDKGYSPENCRFVTPSENTQNRRNTLIFGKKPLVHWYEQGHASGLEYSAFAHRLSTLKWPICRALYQPVNKSIVGTHLATGNQRKFESISDAARQLDLFTSNISNVLFGKRKSTGGWTFEYFASEL